MILRRRAPLCFERPFCVQVSLMMLMISNQVEHEFIYYVHDSSETLADSFTVVANDTGLRKQSAAQTVYIQVTAVNDEPPVIAANRVLRVSLQCCSIFKPWTHLFFLTCRSGTVAYCQTVFMWAVLQVAMAGWLHEGKYVCYVDGGGSTGGLAAQNRHRHTFWRCLGVCYGVCMLNL